MRTLKLLSIPVLIAGLAISVYAQRGMRQGGGHYNPTTETTVTGIVDQIKTMPSPGRGGSGLRLLLAVPMGPLEVHVGPASFVTSKNVTFANGDVVTVVGSKVMMEGQEVMIAREIRNGDQILTLRDAKGFPLWSGRGGLTR